MSRMCKSREQVRDWSRVDVKHRRCLCAAITSWVRGFAKSQILHLEMAGNLSFVLCAEMRWIVGAWSLFGFVSDVCLIDVWSWDCVDQVFVDAICWCLGCVSIYFFYFACACLVRVRVVFVCEFLFGSFIVHCF